MMKSRAAIFFSIFSFTSIAVGAGSIGIPHRIYYNNDGYTYVLLKTGNNQTGCFYGASYGSHRMSNTAADYDSKLSLIMMAFAAGKTLHLQDTNPIGSHTFCDIDLITVTD